MNPQVRELVLGYRSGSIPVDVYLKRMQELGHDPAAATRFLVDQEVETRRPATPPAAPTPAPQPAPQTLPPVRAEVPLTMSGPAPGMDDPNALTPAMRGPLQEDRATRSRLADLPTDRGSPAGDMAFPSRLPPSLTSAPIRQAIDVAKSRAAAPRMASETASEPSGIAALIRGRFGEAAKGSPFDDRLTAAQEARDRMGEGRASGGEVSGKGGNARDAALHKALDIIHYMLTNR